MSRCAEPDFKDGEDDCIPKGREPEVVAKGPGQGRVTEALNCKCVFASARFTESVAIEGGKCVWQRLGANLYIIEFWK